MMSDHYIDQPTGFEGTASDHLKEEMQRIQIRLRQLVGENLRSVNFWVNASCYRDECLEGTFELSVRVDGDTVGNDDSITYKHSGPTLDAAMDHVVRHIEADLAQPDIEAGSFIIPKLIAAQ